MDRGNSSPHAAAAAVGSFRSVLLLNSLREQQLKKGQTIILLCAASQQTEARLCCWLVYQIISELYNSTGNFITPTQFWVDQKNVGYWSGLVEPKLGSGAHCDNHNRLKLCIDADRKKKLLGRPLAVAAPTGNCPISKNVSVRTPRLSLAVLCADFGALALVAKQWNSARLKNIFLYIPLRYIVEFITHTHTQIYSLQPCVWICADISRLPQ